MLVVVEKKLGKEKKVPNCLLPIAFSDLGVLGGRRAWCI